MTTKKSFFKEKTIEEIKEIANVLAKIIINAKSKNNF